MPKPQSDIASLIASFTSHIDGIIASSVDAKIAEVMNRLSFLRPAAPPVDEQPVRRVYKVRSPAPPPAPLLPLPKAREATVIPPEVKITRLPPGPGPGQRSYSQTRSQCRVPGCLTKNAGPRYDVMCRDHYSSLNSEERAKMKELWKAGQARA